MEAGLALLEYKLRKSKPPKRHGHKERDSSWTNFISQNPFLPLFGWNLRLLLQLPTRTAVRDLKVNVKSICKST